MTLSDKRREDVAKAAYRERGRIQCLSWAKGEPYHNRIDNECCPDFSCCVPDLFEQDQVKRWETYRLEYEGGGFQ